MSTKCDMPDPEGEYDFRGKWPDKIGLLASAAGLARLVGDRFVPPFHFEDVIAMVGQDIAGSKLIPALSPRDRVSSLALVHCEVVGVKIAAEANRTQASIAGYFPTVWTPRPLTDGELLDFIGSRYLRWVRDVLQPALGEPGHPPSDHTDRAIGLRKWTQRLFTDKYRPDATRTVEELEAAYFESYGTPMNDPNPSGEFGHHGGGWRAHIEGARGTLEFLHNLGASAREVMVVEGDSLGVDRRAARRAIRGAVEPDRRLRIGDRPVHTSEAEEGGQPEPEADPSAAPGPEVVEVLRRLRSLRDARDHELLEPALHVVESEIGLQATDGHAEVSFLEHLIALLGETTDVAQQAALVYEACAGAHSRAEVARRYGVTPRRVERRGEWARGELARLRQATA